MILCYTILMLAVKNTRGFTLMEILVGVAIFVLFTLGIYGGINLVFKIVYQSRVNILETAALSEELDVVRNLAYNDVGIQGGVPAGTLPLSKTIVRNGISYYVTTTVRNIDDPFDGVLGGNPNDASPADYKLVEMAIQCASCTQRTPVTLSTVVGPKNLEGSSKNGALFIHVFDSAGLPVVGANIHIANSASSPATTIDDVTGNDGYLRVVDAPTGTLSYAISVSKAGYSSDGTVASSQNNPNPVTPPANVVTQAVTNISFAIDRAGAFNISTVNASCAAVPNVALTLRGTKLIGTDPLVYKYDQNFSTDGSGFKSLNPMEWDTYYFGLGNGTYDIVGAIPQRPVKLDPGVTQNVTLVLKSHTTNSLLVSVKDAGTGLPLSDATVELVGTGYDETVLTGLGYLRQTDWSGGGNQVSFGSDNKYWSDDGGLNTTNPSGDIKLKKAGNNYIASGWLESSTFDAGQGVDFKNIVIEPLAQPVQTGASSIRFQIATSNSSTPSSWNFLGPDGTNSTYYTTVNTTIASASDGHRYLRYRLYLSTNDTKYSPQLSEVAITYANSCTPPGQTFFSGLSSQTYTLSVTRSGYVATTSTLDVAGTTETVVNMSPP